MTFCTGSGRHKGLKFMRSRNRKGLLLDLYILQGFKMSLLEIVVVCLKILRLHATGILTIYPTNYNSRKIPYNNTHLQILL